MKEKTILVRGRRLADPWRFVEKLHVDWANRFVEHKFCQHSGWTIKNKASEKIVIFKELLELLDTAPLVWCFVINLFWRHLFHAVQ